MIKSTVVLVFIILAVLFVALVLPRRDSIHFHRLSKFIAPVSSAFMSVKQPAKQTQFLVENFDARDMSAGWQWFQRELVTVDFSGGSLVLETTAESVWYQNMRGPMLYRDFVGDGAVSVTVKTRKSSDPESYPDSQWQFGGLIFRDPASDAWFARENYVFNVIGYRYQALQVEIKSTVQGRSDVSAFDWSSGDAELMIERRGSLFILKARPIGGQKWQILDEYSRPDFPEILQVGVIVYSYSQGRGVFDLKAKFDMLELKSF
jgi:hypothetical protein